MTSHDTGLYKHAKHTHWMTIHLLAHLEEWVIVSNVRRNPNALANAMKAYAEATSSSVKLLTTKIEHMDKDFQAAKQREEQSTGFSREEMKKAIFLRYHLLRQLCRGCMTGLSLCTRQLSINMALSSAASRLRARSQAYMSLLITYRNGQ